MSDWIDYPEEYEDWTQDSIDDPFEGTEEIYFFKRVDIENESPEDIDFDKKQKVKATDPQHALRIVREMFGRDKDILIMKPTKGFNILKLVNLDMYMQMMLQVFTTKTGAPLSFHMQDVDQEMYDKYNARLKALIKEFAIEGKMTPKDEWTYVSFLFSKDQDV